MTDRDDEELAELADELADVLRELRDELRASRRQRDQTGGLDIDLPSPPSPGELLTFTDEQLIPAAIAILEANIRALELLQGTIRLARPGRAGEHASSVRAGAESMSRSTLERLDDVLADLQDAATEGGLPPDSEARDVVTEARRLRDEIDDALAERTDESEPKGEKAQEDEGGQDEEEDGSDDPFGFEEQPEVDVDVEGELESIKAELGKVEEDPDQPGAGETGEETDGADADESETDETEDESDEQDEGDDREGADGGKRADGDDE